PRSAPSRQECGNSPVGLAKEWGRASLSDVMNVPVPSCALGRPGPRAQRPFPAAPAGDRSAPDAAASALVAAPAGARPPPRLTAAAHSGCDHGPRSASAVGLCSLRNLGAFGTDNWCRKSPPEPDNLTTEELIRLYANANIDPDA